MSVTSHPTMSDAAAAEKFQWPAPSQFEFIRGEGQQDWGECLLIFSDGAKATGHLVDFLPEQALLKFQPGGASASVSIVFSGFVSLHLLRPLRLERQKLPMEFTEGDVFTPSEHQSFCVHMKKNAERFQGETIGFVSRNYGLFLFLPEEEGGVVRCFLPAQSIESFDIGSLIGQMLIDHQLASTEAVQAALAKQREMRAQKLGNYLTENQIVSSDQLVAALKRQQAKPILKLGESLVELGFLTESELEEALKNQAKNRKMPLGQILSNMGVVDPEVVRFVLANKLGIPFVNLQKFAIAPEVLSKVTAQMAYRYQIMPVCESEGALVVALEDPMSMGILEDLQFKIGMKMAPVMASAEDIRYTLESNYGSVAEVFPEGTIDSSDERAVLHSAATEIGIDELTSRLAAESGELDLTEEQVVDTDSTLVRLVNRIILDAIRQKASDIHIESNPGHKSTRIRFRKDGTLVDYLDLPSRFRNALISRIKIMSRLDITERRKPQDGKIDFSQFGPARVELRVATIPTTNSLEHAVLRVLAAAKPIPIDQLSFDADALAAVKRLISRPHGLFLVCGPTGSGKTTTLHSLLGFINKPERKIWTAEDPIEITQPGLCQVQVNSKIGWTFAAAMRSFLRADPDVIMVGEIRDAETAEIGIQASLTGHLVLSTLHTNSAAESIVRLLDLGMDPFNFADSLRGILAQRLTKRLCPSCKTAYTPTAMELEELVMEYCNETSIDTRKQMDTWLGHYAGPKGKITIYRARGCEYCNHTGLRGRIGLYELLVADPAVKQLVQSRAPVTDVQNAAMASGMRTLKQDGIDKILQGLTDLHQVRAVCT